MSPGSMSKGFTSRDITSTGIIRQLVMKDLDLHRRFIPAVLLAGIVSLAATAIEGIGSVIGPLMFITTIVAFGLLIGMYGVAQERDKQIHLFVLSLPVTMSQYIIAKVISSLVCFLAPWLILTLATLAAILGIDNIPSGLVPYVVLMQIYFVCNFCLFLAVVLVTSAERWIVATIIVTNMSLTLAIYLLGSIPSIALNMETDNIVWSPTVVAIIFAQLAVCVLVLSAAVAIQKQKRDVI